MKKIIFFITLILVVVFFGRNLNPFSNSMFTFNDETQPARIQQFVLGLKNLQIPPRLAPDFSFKLGYPVFNFYAPASYWITSILSLSGLDTISALKLSFLLSILIGFISSFFFFREFFNFYPSLTASILYISSLYYPLDIFVRGNLGEAWFLALFPLVLLFVVKTAKKPLQLTFFFSTIVLSLLFTVHNLLSTVSVVLVLGFTLFLPNKKINILTIILALLLSSYFFIPLIVENHLTYASYVAKQTKYTDHFVCANQLWQSPWGYGGSTIGCNDGMSLKIGKFQLFFAALGLYMLFVNFRKFNKNPLLKTTSYLLLIISIGSLFMSTYLSKPIWDLFSPILSLFQFPWRFIEFSLIGLSFLSAYLFNEMRFRFKNLVLVFIVLFVFIIQSKYFTGQVISKEKFEKNYLSKEYIEQIVAYKIAEYLPKTANYKTWKTHEKKPPKKEIINIHYFPFWTILIDEKPYIPTKFDELGRPVVDIKNNSSVQIIYKETPVEKTGNVMSMITFVILLYIVKSKKLWNKLISLS